MDSSRNDADYLFAHQDDPEPTEADLAVNAENGSGATATKEEGNGGEGTGEAGSLKCDDCGKLFKTSAHAEFHATRSGHQNFSESTEVIAALTEAEKTAKLAELKAKLAAKRAVQAKEDIAAAKANELIKRKSGAEAREAREKLEQQQMLKDIAQKKRDKQADKAALDAIRRQVEEDRKARLVYRTLMMCIFL